jgi:hypothetical protein
MIDNLKTNISRIVKVYTNSILYNILIVASILLHHPSIWSRRNLLFFVFLKLLRVYQIYMK